MFKEKSTINNTVTSCSYPVETYVDMIITKFGLQDSDLHSMGKIKHPSYVFIYFSTWFESIKSSEFSYFFHYSSDFSCILVISSS